MRLEISGDYTPDWPTISLQTRNEAGWRCVRCRHGFWPATGHPLLCDAGCDPRRCKATLIRERGGRHNYGVHHLDGNKGNNAWWNRLALCNSCHLYIQASVIPERLYMFQHSEWFTDYVCGYYASVAGFTVTRAEVIADRARWLALGQPHLYATSTP